MDKNILIIAGDASGDVYAAELAKRFKAQKRGIKISALGGLRLKATSDDFLYDLVGGAAHGFFAPLLKIPTWIKLLRLVKNYFLKCKPHCVILVDFYGFNRRILSVAAKCKIPAYYYICPQVWASRRYRAKAIVRFCKKMFVIFPFEKKIYSDIGGDAVFLGHPLLDFMPNPVSKRFSANKNRPVKIGLLPGSRAGEIEGHTELIYESFLGIKKRYPAAKAYLFAVPEFADAYYRRGLPAGAEVKIIRETDYSARRQMDFVITCSGTATLENALLGLPMSVVYKTGWITYHIAKLIIRVPYISLVNILQNKEVVKEFIQKNLSAKAVAKNACQVLCDKKRFNAMRKDMLALKARLGNAGMPKRAAEIITEELWTKS
jgi:lipid-A-disaccharide synthase